MNFMKTVQKVKEVMKEEIISGNDTFIFVPQPANVPHAVRAEQKFKMLLLMLRA